MNKVIRNLSIFCFSFLCSLSNISTSNINSSLINDNGVFECNDHCCNENEHVHHEIEGKPIIGLPSTLSFNKTMATSSSEYGEVTVKANYQPEGCLTDTIWDSSNPSVIRIDVDELESSVATLVCLSPFEGEITITARSVYFEDISYSCKATYKDNFEITPLVSSVELKGKRYKSCPGVSTYSFSYQNQVDVKSLYEISENVDVIYEVSGTGFTLNGDYLRMTSAVTTGGSIKIIPVGYAEKAITIKVNTSFDTDNGSHSYNMTLESPAHTSTTSWGSWGGWTITSYPSCTSEGERRRTRTGTYYSYTAKYKYTCKYCSSYYYEGGDSKKHTTTDYDYETLDALGHDYTYLLNKEVSPSCENTGTTAKYRCTRCSSTTGGSSIPALGHDWETSYRDELYNYNCGNCGYDTNSTSHPPICPKCSVSAWTAEYKKVQDGMECSRCGKHS